MDRCIDGGMNVSMNVCIYRLINKWVDRCINGGMNVSMNIYIYVD